jgi:hypothetical protein
VKRVIVMLALLGGVASADDKKAAQRFFSLGAKAYAAQNFGAAATNFDEAFKQYAKPEIAFSAAQAYRRLYQVEPRPEHVKRAIELYQFYLGAVKTGGRVGDAADNLADMKRELAKLEAAGLANVTSQPVQPHTRLGVNVSVPDAGNSDLGALREISEPTGEAVKGLRTQIDGKPVDAFSLVEVEPKEHVIDVSADGYFPVQKKAFAVENQSIYVDVELRPRPAKLAVKTEDDARITIDGRYVATAPTGALEIGAGKHLVSVLRNGREPFATELTVARGQELALDAQLRKTSRRKAVPWVLGGAGVLAAGAVTTGLFALSRDHRARDLRDGIAMGNRPASDADALDSAVRSRDRLVTWTWLLGGAAVIAGGVGGFLLVFDRPDTDSATIGVGAKF